MKHVVRFGALIGLALLLTACGGLNLAAQEVPTAAVPVTVAGFASPTPATAMPQVNPAGQPTESPRTFIGYQHSSRVFSLLIPDDWQAVEQSTGQKLRVLFVPPPGYGSRVTVETHNVGTAAEVEVRPLTEAYLDELTSHTPGYSEIEREDLPDGRVRVRLAYDDGRGGRGQELLISGASGPYFTVMRAFLAEGDISTLATALDGIANSLAVNSAATWGAPAAAINPAELLLINTSLWRDDAGIVYYAGELYNASAYTILDPQVSISFCNPASVVIAEITRPAALRLVESGETVPFGVTLSGTDTIASVCGEAAIAQPAPVQNDVATNLVVQAGVTGDGDALIISGQVTNTGSSTVADPAVAIVIYDEAGGVVGYTRITFGAGATLEAGASQSFRHTFTTLGGEDAEYATLAQGRLLPPDPAGTGGGIEDG